MKDNQAKYPQLRFKGFTDPWEQRKFEYLLDENDGIRRGPFGSALKKECFVSQSDYVVYEQQNAIYNKYETRYNITKDKFEELKKFELKPEDFIMSGAGTIGRISRVPHGIDKGVFNQALIRFRIDNRITDSEYFLQFIRADFMQKKLTSTNPGSAITNLVPMSEVKKWGILVPQINEQSKIGIFFKQLDKTITLHQRKLAKLKELKQGYLQKMFPKNGSKFPQLRFSGFADAWEQCKLRGILAERNDQITETNEYPLMSFVQGKGVTPKGKRYNRSFLVKDVDKKYKKTELGDFIYSSNNLETGSIGFNRTGKAVISPVYSIFKSKREQESQFIGIMSARKDFIFKMIRFRQGVVYGQWRIHESDFLNIDIRIPSYEEQQSIICFFEKLNKAITLHQRKLEKLQELKKGYLQKMFC
ncbi:restriction endonuclease subunit S [Fructilactobacillus lindneri]|nr:restriction endonuclease subunit S [Fructilactobacillus lindneri]POH05096.1 hypothetical protein BGL35_06895 [Fructilactobacillus lindneri]POH22662.1 hypothetical protein BHU33_06930 [Fructilactobacillus lindneri DSM 20690 = JCM 11027]SKA06841.1 type I restriction enzyme, S subunit [Fructilactobacillus lindneri DSM 20690 = JCM 11027]